MSLPKPQKGDVCMDSTLKNIVEFTISLAFNIHKLMLIYTSVFIQYFERKDGEAYNG